MVRPDPSVKHVAALGGSAGALPVMLRQLGRLFKQDSSALFLIWHRAPGTRFELDRFVPDDVRFRVEEAQDGDPVRPNVAYYPHDAHDLAVEDDRLVVTPPAGRYRPSIDRLFASLARTYGERTIAVLLSGGGNDGVQGLADVQAHGGTTIVQDPDTASVPALPRAAVKAGVADHVLATREILRVVDEILEEGRSPIAG